MTSTKLFTLINGISLLLFLCLLEKIYSFKQWESFPGCNVYKECKYKSTQEMLIAYAKGVPDIKNKTYDEEFFICQELFFLCGYVKIHASGPIIENSGVNIGIGVDLKDQSDDRMKKMGIQQSIIDKLKPYFGLREEAALKKLNELKNLTLSENEARELTYKVKQYFYRDLINYYSDVKKTENATRIFNDLHLSVKTALFSFYYDQGKLNYDDVLGANDWNKLADIFEKIESNKIRRKAEALLLHSIQQKCEREMYLSILMDESGSISQTDFDREINFVAELIKRNSNNNNIIISLFSFSDRVTKLSNFESDKNLLLKYLNSHKKISGGTNTGEAILKSRQLFVSTDSYINKTLDSRVMIIITDGQSNDRTFTVSQADITRKSGIQILSVGVGSSIKLDELQDMSGGEQNVMLIDNFEVLIQNLQTLNNGVCTQNSPIGNNETFTGEIKNNERIYLEVAKNKLMNQRISLNDTVRDNNSTSESNLIFCVSYQDPYPNENSNEICHFGRNQGTKELVIYNKETADKKQQKNFEKSSNLEKETTIIKLDEISGNLVEINSNQEKILRYLQDEKSKETLYISIKGKNVKFTIKAEECDPNKCKYGTNDSNGISIGLIVFIVFLILSALLLGFYFGWKYILNKKEQPLQDSISTDYGKISQH